MRQAANPRVSGFRIPKPGDLGLNGLGCSCGPSWRQKRLEGLQRYIAHKKLRPTRTLQEAYA